MPDTRLVDLDVTQPMATDQTPFIGPVDQFAAARGLQTPTWIYDIDSCRVLHANPAACALWHADSEAELQKRDMSQDMSPTVYKRLQQYKADFIERDATFKEMWTLYPAGAPANVMVHFRGFRLLDGRMAMQCEVFGEADDQPENLRSAEALLHTDVMITLFGYSGPPLYMNPAARNVCHEANASLSQMFTDDDDYSILMFELEATGEHRRVARVYTAAGQRWFDLSAKQCSDAITGEPAILITAIDVSELKNAKDRARYLANRDQLTGCFNRAYLQHYMARSTTLAGTRQALLFFDVDRFKQINDTFGHETGDAVLIELATRVSNLAGPDDVVARLGGDEFVVVISDADDHASLKARVDRLFQSLCEPVRCGTTTIPTKISMGVSVFHPGYVELDTVLRQADKALYISKNEGRNRYTFYDAKLGEAVEQRSRTEAEIERGLHAKEFVLHYQPRIDVRTGRIASVEGLARWMHPERGLVMPNEFIPICEETGMIEALGQHVLRLGFQQARIWQEADLDTCVSLNISPRQFADTALLETLEACSKSDAFVPGQIELEITESVLIGEHDGIAAKLRKITDMGFEIAIDDFGTGYSNLSYISRFPLHRLKIDRSFIAQLPQSGPIVRLILSLAQQIGAKAVAEGVETREQFEWLAHHNCDQVQGFYFAKAMPAAEVQKLLHGATP
ncbi:EAL domain-containing protein [Gymnodinialimonas sp. 2305UL16-5]|uniref:putative bifunctional diguanylate cyclase/phosphodiesterase n=1 Tax=Gymnodinialimonas mytili TaxID=3126503 RepID=UPI0030986609